MLKLCVKFEQNRTIRCRVIDDLAHCRCEIFEGVTFTRKDLMGASPVVTKFVSELRYLAAFSNAGLKVERRSE